MIKEGLAPLVKRMMLIKKEAHRDYLLWAYFDLVKTVLLATGLKEGDGGNGRKYVLTLPTGSYYRMSFTLGFIRVLGIGHYLRPTDQDGIIFIFQDIGLDPNRDGWLRWKWSTFKRSEARGNRTYLTLNPQDLLEYGETRLKWLECVSNIAAIQSNNQVKYGTHNPLIYHAAMNIGFRTLLFREAGIAVQPEWLKD